MSEEKFIRVTLRLPRQLHETLAALADRKTSTTNAEVVSRLERSLLEDERGHAGSSDQVSKDDVKGLKLELEAMLDRKFLALALALNTGGGSLGQQKSLDT
jgi:hypothetical protein